MPLRSPSALSSDFAEHDADVLDGVVLIDVEIAGGAAASGRSRRAA